MERDWDCEIEQIDRLIEAENWEEVLEWACRRYCSSNEEICKKVIDCYRLCAERKMPAAALNLGTFYYTGRYVEQDYKKAYQLYQIAAEAGELQAICNCGYCFYYGRHQEADYGKAREYFSLGALLYDDANCLYKLGDLYLNGYGVEQNDTYAFLLYSRALDRCMEEDDDCTADAQLRVGKCLLCGIGTEPDIERAHELLSYALLNFYRRRGTDHFAAGRIQSAKELIAEAQRRLDEQIDCL